MSNMQVNRLEEMELIERETITAILVIGALT